MSYKFMPFVLETDPVNMAVDVPVSTAISITFSTDMDPATLPGNVIVQTTSGGVKVEGDITYRDRAAVFRPARPLDPGTSYTVIVAGDAHLEDGKFTGVRSILGYPMAGVFTFTFTTATCEELPAPVPVAPAGMSTVALGRVRFAWTGVSGAADYEVQVSTSPTMEPLLWGAVVAGTEVVPDSVFEEGNYFWRVRACQVVEKSSPDGTVYTDHKPGLWSPVVSFAVALPEAGSAESSEVPVAEAGLLSPAVTVGVEPSLDSIVVRLPYAVRAEDVRVRLVGKSLANDPAEDHGLVPVSVDVATDGVTSTVTIRPQGEGG